MDRFERAATELMTRYPILCSRLDISGGEPVQRYGGPRSSLEIVDISGYTDRQADSTLSARADEQLDLFQENPFRIILAITGLDEAILMVLVHHVFLDAPALQTVLSEYTHLALTDSPSFTDVPRYGGDHSFVAWAEKQQEMMSDGTFSRRAPYWISHLDGADPALHLRGRQSDDPAVWSPVSTAFSLRGNEFQAFSHRASRLGVTRFALATSAIFHVLHEAAAQDNILLTVITNTRRPPFGRTIGQFAGTFPIRQNHDDSGITDNAIRLVYQEIMMAIRNYVPDAYFSEEVSWLRERYAKGYSLTDISVDSTPGLTDIGKDSVGGRHEISRFRLTARARPANIPYHGLAIKYFLHPGSDSLEGVIEYESAIAGTRTAEAMTTSLLSALTLP